MAAAVLRAIGSTMTCAPGRSPSCASTWSRWLSPVTTIGGRKPSLSLHRASVASNRVESPISGRKGLGKLLRDRGHNRVPLPPHSTTGTIFAIAGRYSIIAKRSSTAQLANPTALSDIPYGINRLRPSFKAPQVYTTFGT